MNRKTLGAVLALAGACLGHAAQAEDGPWLLRVRAVDMQFNNAQSDGLPLGGSTKVEADNRWIPEFDVSYFWTKNIAAELALTYPQNIDILLDGSRQGTIKALPYSLMVQYHFADLGEFKPYLGLGLNYTNFSRRDNILDGVARVERSSIGFAVQAGADYRLDRHWSVNLDVKYIRMNTDVNVADTKIGNVGLNPLMAGVGVAYRF